uniref:Sugar phosphate transporter domain-containing protein n=1 Tax=Strigamia maritima TaxID=126957 RepID=T1JEB5_STRMM
MAAQDVNLSSYFKIDFEMLSLKYVSLAVLVVQTTAHVLTIRYSRTLTGIKYLPSTVVVLAEVMKVIASLIILTIQNGGEIVKTSKIFVDSYRLMIPAVLYVVQNNLLYIALTNLDAATYQITYQLKIFTTAIFAVVLLGKRLKLIRWVALVLLMLGVALIQLPEANNSRIKSDFSVRSIGIFAIICACLSSGFAGIYFEKLLKGSSQSLWIRNIQLGSNLTLLNDISMREQ